MLDLVFGSQFIAKNRVHIELQNLGFLKDELESPQKDISFLGMEFSPDSRQKFMNFPLGFDHRVEATKHQTKKNGRLFWLPLISGGGSSYIAWANWGILVYRIHECLV